MGVEGGGGGGGGIYIFLVCSLVSLFFPCAWSPVFGLFTKFLHFFRLLLPPEFGAKEFALPSLV